MILVRHLVPPWVRDYDRSWLSSDLLAGLAAGLAQLATDQA